MSYRCAHGVAHAEVEATLLVHGVVKAGQRRQRGPVVVDEVDEEALDVGAILILSAGQQDKIQ